MKRHSKVFNEPYTCNNDVSKESKGNVKMNEDDYIIKRASEVDLFARHEEFKIKSSLDVKRELEAAISDLDDDTKSTIRRCVRGLKDRCAHTERIHGVQRFIEGMLDAEVPDYLIIKLLGKHWFIGAEKATKDLNRIKTRLHPINEVCHYMGMMGFSDDEIAETTSLQAYEKLIEDHELWKLPVEELYGVLADQRKQDTTRRKNMSFVGKDIVKNGSSFIRRLLSKSKGYKPSDSPAEEWREFKRIINGPEDIEDVKQKLDQCRDIINNDELPTLEELRARLEALQKSFGDK